MTPRKTAKEIADTIIAQLEQSLNQTIKLLPKAFNRVLAKVLGGVFVSLYQFAGFILLQMFVKTASNEEFTVGGIPITPLKLWGQLVGIFQKDGEQAEYQCSVNVITLGETLPSGTQVVNPDTELLYLTIGDVLLDSPVTAVPIRAVESNAASNLDLSVTNVILSFVSAPAYVEKDLVAFLEDVEGADPETTEDFRERILDRFAARPQGGAYADYRVWGEEVDGVANIYPYSGGTQPTSGSGQVDVYVESENDPDGIPTQTLLDEVKDAIELDEAGLATRRPVNAYVNTYPISRETVDVIVSGLNTPDVGGTQQAIYDGLVGYFLGREPFIDGLSVPPRKDNITNSEVGGVVGRIAASKGGTVAAVEVSQGGVPFDILTLQEGVKAKLGSLTWT